jgi:hypothetical protein
MTCWIEYLVCMLKVFVKVKVEAEFGFICLEVQVHV